MRWLIAIVLLSVCSLPVFALSPPPSYADAQRAFDQLPLNDRLNFKSR